MPRGKTLRENLAISSIALGRRLFANTPVQRLPVTGVILKRIFKFGYGEGQMDVSFRGVELRVPASDITIVPGLVGGFFEEIELDIFAAVVGRSSSMVDVGANVGIYTCLAATLIGDGQVVSFEPVPANLDYLARNVAQNGVDSKVKIIARAVSNAPGVQPIYLAGNMGAHSLSPVSPGSESPIDVEVTTLDEALGDQPVDVLKIDIEGFDGHALRGGMRLLKSQRPTLFVEFVPRNLSSAGSSPQAMIELICSTYDHVFVIDEPRRTVGQASKAELLKLAESSAGKNLVGVSNQRHLDAIRAVIADRSGPQPRSRISIR